MVERTREAKLFEKEEEEERKEKKEPRRREKHRLSLGERKRREIGIIKNKLIIKIKKKT